jgi:hypothetical protein
VRLRIGMALAAAMVCSWTTWIHGGTDGSSWDVPQSRVRTGFANNALSAGTSGTPQLDSPVRKGSHGAERAGMSPAIRLAADTGPGAVAANARDPQTVPLPDTDEFQLLARDPLDMLRLENIKPLYTSPAMPGEGVWETSGCPRDFQGRPIVYKTFYRPSVAFPNAIVFVMVVDMSKVDMQYYVGSQEPAARLAASTVEPENRRHIMAVTNAMWMQRHSKGAGAIFRGKEVYPMVDGMATLIVYKDGSMDVREWSADIPRHLVNDARQLLHLIVKDGMVVQTVQKGKRMEDAEIGLGFLLGGGGKDADGKHFWYVAHRSAFGVRSDGNLVFAIGHHIGSKDLAKAMVLAGCDRAMHADANPDNIVGNLYIRDSFGNLVRKVKLSPEQSKYSLNRYEKAYTKDFFAFFFKGTVNPDQQALTRRSESPARRNH